MHNSTPYFKYLFSLVLSLVTLGVCAQQDISLYTLGNVSQRTYVNPAYFPASNVNVGLPGISSVYLRVSNTGFNLGKFIEAGERGVIDTDDILNSLSEKNIFATNVAVDALSFGFKVKEAYISFNTTTKVAYDLTYPKDLFRLALLGNGHPDLLGRRVSLDGFGNNVQTYQETGLGISLPIGNSARVGVRAKYLLGLAALNTFKSQLGVYTDPETYAITLDGKYGVQTSGIELYEEFDSEEGLTKEQFEDLGKKLSKNNGFGFDLGLEFNLTNRLSVSAAVLDIGSISWNYGVQSFESDTINFNFDGIDVSRLVNNNERTQVIEELRDSVQALLTYTESNSSFTTTLNTQFIAGLNYELFNKNMIGVIARSEIINKTIRPSFSLYYTARVKNWLSATVNYSYLDKSFLNLGAGFTIKAGPIQLYAVTDNVLAHLALQTARGVQFRTGVNLVFGGKERRKLFMPVQETKP